MTSKENSEVALYFLAMQLLVVTIWGYIYALFILLLLYISPNYAGAHFGNVIIQAYNLLDSSV